MFVFFLESGWMGGAQVHHGPPKPPDVAAKSPTEMPQMDVERRTKKPEWWKWVFPKIVGKLPPNHPYFNRDIDHMGVSENGGFSPKMDGL